MNLYFRLLYILLKGFLKKAPPSKKITDPTALQFIVLPNDLDLNRHMNNGRYFTIMDLGRIDFMRQIGLLKKVIRNKWFPVLSASQMAFFRPLKIFQRYTLHTYLEYWDEKCYVIRQHFEIEGKIYAIGKVRGLFRDKKGTIPCHRVLELADCETAIKPYLSPETKLWLEGLDKDKDLHLKSKKK